MLASFWNPFPVLDGDGYLRSSWKRSFVLFITVLKFIPTRNSVKRRINVIFKIQVEFDNSFGKKGILFYLLACC